MIWRVISIADIMPKNKNTWNLINSHGRCDVYPISRKCTAEIKCIRGLNQKVFISITEAARPTTCGSLFSLDVKLFQKARFNNVTFLITTRKRGCQSSSFLSCEMLSVVIRVILWWRTLFFLFFFPRTEIQFEYSYTSHYLLKLGLTWQGVLSGELLIWLREHSCATVIGRS